MLTLKHIQKSYSRFALKALDDVSISFRQNEFVAILGPRGSGKTTLLNLIGGLDRYTDGDMIINGISTKKYSSADWDFYRNHSVGFVFQSYNLIPHQSVLANVELALTLSGVSRKERRARAKQALEQVGLGEQLRKKPNEMSGGQMQRVAIARALVNNPDILLADEPTGALDSVTSVQIMDLLKEVARDRLVVMVTHNPDLAQEYATRIVRLKDGKVTDDSNPFDGQDAQAAPPRRKKTSMSFLTALSLSLNNLMTKKTRTFLTSFAGSIGIIGIALILSLSTGINAFINQVQEDTLSSYPISIMAEEVDMSSLITSLMRTRTKQSEHEKDAVYANAVMLDLMNSVNGAETTENNLKKLREYFEQEDCALSEYVRAVQYLYNVPLYIYVKTEEDAYQRADISELFSTSSFGTRFSSLNTWGELLDDREGGVSPMVTEQYELVAGAWPAAKDELLLVLDNSNEITDMTLQALGLKTNEQIFSDLLAARNGQTVQTEIKRYTYEEIMARQFKLIAATDLFVDSDGDGIWEDIRENDASMDVVIAGGLDLRIAGIVRPKDDAAMLTASLYYTHDMTEYLLARTAESELARAQQAEENKNLDLLTGLPFVLEEEAEPTQAQKAQELKEYFASLPDEKKPELYRTALAWVSEEEANAFVQKTMERYPDRAALEDMIFNQYAAAANMDEDTIRAFIAEYDDDALHAMVEEQLRAMFKAQKENQADAELEKIALTPSDAELTPLKARITAQLTDRTAKTGYILSRYTETTSLPAETIMGYLMTQDDASIDRMVDSLALEQATALYESMAQADSNAAQAKQAAAFDAYTASLSEEELAELYEPCMPPKTSSSTLKDNLELFGVADASSPSEINLYASSFADKDEIAAIIASYNEQAEEDDKISYTDYVALIMSSVTMIIDVISYVLIAFVSISLVVSSIMIGIITYISVLERTKEIGILRAIGASKRDISRVFNAETLLIGLTSGLIGIVLTVLLCLPINAIIRFLSGIPTLTAFLPLAGAVVLVGISMLLTLIAGLVPSRIAAKKDPVEALRSE